jgi:FkbM family methyltransferase
MLNALGLLLKAIPKGHLPLSLRRALLRRGMRDLSRDFAQPHARYFSQYGQDLFADAFLFRGRRGGYFVDIGAYDGVTYSNTFFLERELGWQGICFEPNPEAFRKLSSARSCTVVNAGIGPREGSLQFLALPESVEMGSGFLDYFPEHHRDPGWADLMCRNGATLRNIHVLEINAAVASEGRAAIDYLSIDAEGADFAILRALDLRRFDIEVIDVENNLFGDDICVYLDRQGYELRGILGSNEIYQKRRPR